MEAWTDGRMGKSSLTVNATANSMGLPRTLFFRIVGGESGSPPIENLDIWRTTDLFPSQEFPAAQCMTSPRAPQENCGSPIKNTVFFACPREARFGRFLGATSDLETMRRR